MKPLAPFQDAPPRNNLSVVSLARSGQMSPSCFDPVTGARSPQFYRWEPLSSVTHPKANTQGNGCCELLVRICIAPGGAQRFGWVGEFKQQASAGVICILLAVPQLQRASLRLNSFPSEELHTQGAYPLYF